MPAALAGQVAERAHPSVNRSTARAKVRRMKSKTYAYTAALMAAVLLAGCGGDKADDGSTAPTGPSGQASATDGSIGNAPAVSGATGSKPSIAVPTGNAPTELIRKDIKKGSGKKAGTGDSVSVQYVGINWSDGKEFDASWNSGNAFTFALGAGQVIPGWDQGVKGMRVGGRRQLIIPPELGYGDQGYPPAIKADETLVFVVDLEKVTK